MFFKWTDVIITDDHGEGEWCILREKKVTVSPYSQVAVQKSVAVLLPCGVAMAHNILSSKVLFFLRRSKNMHPASQVWQVRQCSNDRFILKRETETNITSELPPPVLLHTCRKPQKTVSVHRVCTDLSWGENSFLLLSHSAADCSCQRRVIWWYICAFLHWKKFQYCEHMYESSKFGCRIWMGRRQAESTQLRCHYLLIK